MSYALALAAAVTFGAVIGYAAGRHRRGLLAENNHWVGEEIEALKGADLNADVADHRRRHTPPRGQTQLYDQDADRYIHGEFAAPPRHVGAAPGDPGHLTVVPGATGWLVPRHGPMTDDETDRLIASLQALPDTSDLGQVCADCDKPAPNWINVLPHGERSFLCDDHYAAAMADDDNPDHPRSIP